MLITHLIDQIHESGCLDPTKVCPFRNGAMQRLSTNQQQAFGLCDALDDG